MSASSYHALTSPPAPGAPVVFAFHGTGGDEYQFARFVEETLPGAGLVAPRGDVSEHGALRFFRRTGEGIYDMDDLARRTEKMADFVAAWKEAHPGHAVHGFGYSNGANILASVVFARPDLFDRIALLHPLIPFEPGPQPGLAGRRVMISGGRRDPICPPAATGALIDWFEKQGAEMTLAFHDGGHELRQNEIDALVGFLRDAA